MLSVHDTVAQKNYDPVLPPMPDDIDEEEDSVKIIRLVKNREPLVSFPLYCVFFLCLQSVHFINMSYNIIKVNGHFSHLFMTFNNILLIPFSVTISKVHEINSKNLLIHDVLALYRCGPA